jgi:hypothetical protein
MKLNFQLIFLVIITIVLFTNNSSIQYLSADIGVVSVDSFDVTYDIENGNVESIYLDPDFHQLVVIVNTQNDGTLEITIPREILDAKFESEDDVFFTLVDEFETDFVEIESNSTSRKLIIPFFKGDSIIEIIGTHTANPFITNNEIIPDWIKNNAGWWADGLIEDTEFVSGIQYLIKEKILIVPETQSGDSINKIIPDWIKNNAGWWADGLIEDTEFVSGIQYLISHGIIQI